MCASTTPVLQAEARIHAEVSLLEWINVFLVTSCCHPSWRILYPNSWSLITFPIRKGIFHEYMLTTTRELIWTIFDVHKSENNRTPKSIWMDDLASGCGEVAHTEAAMNKSASGSQPLIPIAAVLPDRTFNIYSAVFAESRSSDISLRHEGS